MEQPAGGIGLHVNADKMEYMCFNRKRTISTLNGGSQKLVDSSVLSSENYINMRLAKA